MLVKCIYGRTIEYFVQRGTDTRAKLSVGNMFCKKLTYAIIKNQDNACLHQVCKYDIETVRFEVK